MPDTPPESADNTPTVDLQDGEETASASTPSVLAQGAEAFTALFSEITEGPSQPLADAFDTPPESPRASESNLEDDEWHEFGSTFDLSDIFERSTRKEALAMLREHMKDRLRAQLTPRTILLRDKITFTLGTMDLLVSAYWLGASPRTFYKLFTVKAVLLLLIRWGYYRVKKWHYYM